MTQMTFSCPIRTSKHESDGTRSHTGTKERRRRERHQSILESYCIDGENDLKNISDAPLSKNIISTHQHRPLFAFSDLHCLYSDCSDKKINLEIIHRKGAKMSAFSSRDDHSESDSQSNSGNDDTSETARQTSSGPGIMKFFDQGSLIIWVSRRAVAAIMFIAFVGVITSVFIVTRNQEEESFENEVS
jgi:hypothetical protein